MEKKIKEKIDKKLRNIFNRALSDKNFSGGTVGVSYPQNKFTYHVVTFEYGYTEGVLKKYPVKEATFFDLASLTKPLATVLSLALLLQEKKIQLTDKLDSLLGRAVPEEKKEISLGQLMSHCSGLPPHRNYFTRMLELQEDQRAFTMRDWILAEKLVYKPGKNHAYSDLGYILLGFIVEKISGKKFDLFWRENIAEKLQLEKEIFFPKKGDLNMTNCTATEICPWTKKQLCGKVHDDNCRALGGVGGHAGMFGTVRGVLSLCQTINRHWLGKEENNPFSAEIIRSLLTRRDASTWTYGFDTPTQLYSSSGRYFRKPSVGHLGFTGTSFWIDLQREISVVLLTNRVHPSRKNEAIKNLRPLVYNTIMEEFNT
jgi:serine-type D-Ala-D-Ala carboxypeptidase